MAGRYNSPLSGEQVTNALELINARTPERWAVGSVDGQPVPVTDETYHNNSKYYAQYAHEQAEIAKSSIPEGTAGALFYDRPLDLPEEYQNQAQENIGLKNVLTVSTPFHSRPTANGQPIKDGLASIKSVSGYSWVFNQLAVTARSGTIYGVTFTTNSDGTVSVTGTCTTSTNYTITGSVSVIIGHKYFVKLIATNTNGLSIVNFGTTMPFNGGIVPILDLSSVTGSIRLESGVTYNTKVRLCITDLTLAFGAGNEPTSTDDWRIKMIEAKLAEDGSYNQGEIIDLNGAVKSVGRNIWDEQWELGSYDANGLPVSGTNTIRSKNYIPIYSSATYYFVVPTSFVNNIAVRFYDEKKNHIPYVDWIHVGNITFVAPSQAKYLQFHLNESYGTTYNHDIAIFRGTTALPYEPYTSSTTPLPLLRSAGTVKDTWNNGTVTRKIKGINASELNWSYGQYIGSSWGATISDFKANGSIICGSYAKTAWGALSSGQFAITDKYISVNNGSSSEKPSGLINYELATPTTETFEIPPYSAYLNGTEEIIGDGVLDAEIGYGVDVVKNLMELSDSVNWIYDYLLDSEVRLSMLELFGGNY